ncbi:uncharacterized protein N7503_005399 [Penicillium pulvis]|uniref:uncharacterized protein n=1 Tax=Penicillium pulvis TaxID=1562058 RepID=UPI0025487939|nr:uncharacterized protein N7503_005399 [Penicillium pulvis]KAJ5802949.1 hypothetical protein N7503_005399 [Penicillium pulvis]
MIYSTASKILNFIARRPSPTGFIDRPSAAPTDRHKKLNLKNLQTVSVKLKLAPRTASPEEEQDHGPNLVTEPYEKVICAPLDYLLSIPGKDIRGRLISAFNEWFKLPSHKLVLVKEVVDRLHTASLLIDDIQDASQLRRGHPVAHEVFGVAQTINAANYTYFLQQERLNEIGDPRVFHIFTRALLDLHRGQGMDLYWRDAVVCPTEEEYTLMVIYKTGGLFRLALDLMQIQSSVTEDLSKMVELLGTIFQIRDDYMNLQSGLYTEKKGLMEDLTEGKFSYPIIHSIHAAPENATLINILMQRSEDEVVKKRAIKYMESTGSFQYCRETLSRLSKQARSLVEELEILLGPNKGIHGILDLLHVPSAHGNPGV